MFQYFLEKYRPVVHNAEHINFKDKDLGAEHFYRFNICESRFGRSLVATENIAKGEVIACLPAVFLTDRVQSLSIEIKEVVHEINLAEHLYPLLKADNKTLWQFSHMSTFLDHACWPACNARCDGHRWQNDLLNYSLTALHDIVSGEHISVDYATIEYHADEAAQMHCACQSSGCRKHYCGFARLPDELKKDALKVTQNFLMICA